MQTFLPFPDFDRSAGALDTVRLGKQRVETLQVMRALTIPDYGWRHHPVTRMWRGFRPALMAYQDAVCDEWERRGHADTCRAKTLVELDVELQSRPGPGRVRVAGVGGRHGGVAGSDDDANRVDFGHGEQRGLVVAGHIGIGAH